jgi:protein gp37
MSRETKIEWTDATWNPISGCTPVSSGCENCYARAFAQRFFARRGLPRARAFEPMMHFGRLDLPRRWKMPRRIFVDSMGDLFHPAISNEFIERVFRVIRDCPQHTFQILTKRPIRMYDFDWPDNAWAGVSIENAAAGDRAYQLGLLSAKVHFLSLEPLIGPLPHLNLHNIRWVIVGGENGPRARPMHPAWVCALRDDCLMSGVPFFFKGWGAWKPVAPLYAETDEEERAKAGIGPVDPVVSLELDGSTPVGYTRRRGEWRDHQPGPGSWLMEMTGKKASGRELDGRSWEEMPR